MLAPIAVHELPVGRRECVVWMARRVVMDAVEVGCDLSSFNSCVVVWWGVQNGTVELVAQ